MERDCVWCGGTIEPSRRSHAVYCGPSCRTAAFRARECCYCGLPADTRDHAVPKSLTANDGVVPACKECNCLASTNLYESIEAKREDIQAKLRVRYRKVLSIPEWTDKEIEELGPALRSQVRSARHAKRTVEERLAWRGSASPE